MKETLDIKILWVKQNLHYALKGKYYSLYIDYYYRRIIMYHLFISKSMLFDFSAESGILLIEQ